MKFRPQYMWMVLCLALASFLTFSAFDKQETRQVELTTYEDEYGNKITKDADGNVYTGSDYYAGSNQQKVFPLDTLTNAGTYTTAVPWNMSSAYQYQYFFKLRKIGVTPNIKVVLDERNASASSIWSSVDSFSMSGADSTKLNFRLRGTDTYGSFHRIRYVKTGNGKVARNVEFVIKATD